MTTQKDIDFVIRQAPRDNPDRVVWVRWLYSWPEKLSARHEELWMTFWRALAA